MRKIQIPDEGAESLFGTYDENLKQLETQFGVRIRTTGKELIVEGEPAEVARAERVLDQLTGLMRGGYRLAKGDVKTAAQLVIQDETVELSDYFLRSATKSAGKRQVVPKSVTQKRYLDAIEQHDIVFGIGPAGTGKTYLAMAQAVSFLLAKRVSRIILARPAVEAGEKLGFLPGDLQEKVNPYLRPLYDALYDMIETERAQRLRERGTIEVAPIAFIGGRTLASVAAGRGGPARAPGLAVWRAGGAPATARGDLAIAIVSDAHVRALNRQFRRRDQPTDVLSFSAADPRTSHLRRTAAPAR